MTTFFIFMTVVISIAVYNYSSTKDLELYALTHSPVSIQEGDRLFFYEEGFAIVGEYTNFFDNNGQPSVFPYDFGGTVEQDFTITAVTNNFMLINGDTVYKIDNKSLEKLYTLDTPAIGMKEYGNYLLLSIEDQGNIVSPNFLAIESGILSDMGLDDNLYYLDADYDPSDSSLSVLTIDIGGSYPSSKILHYDENLSLYGFTSAVDQVFYRIFKFPSIAILIGNRKLVCYNIEGNVEWEIENNSINDFQAVRNDLGLLVYFNQKIKWEEQEENFNGIYLNNKGDKKYINLPPQLTNIVPLKDRFLALQYGKNLLIFDSEGRVEKEFLVDEDIKTILTSSYQPDRFFIIKQNGTLQIYSTKWEENQ